MVVKLVCAAQVIPISIFLGDGSAVLIGTSIWLTRVEPGVGGVLFGYWPVPAVLAFCIRYSKPDPCVGGLMKLGVNTKNHLYSWKT